MNGHWNAYCAYTQSGRRKAVSHPTGSFRKAFARIYLLLHGGTATQLSARPSRLELPGVTHDYERNPFPTLRVICNPQGYGSPNLPGNTAQAYYPGNRYVDVVGNDLYDIRGKGRVDRERPPLQGAPLQGVRDPRVGPLGPRRPGLRQAPGRLGEDPEAVPALLARPVSIRAVRDVHVDLVRAPAVLA
jgi:hypothetical protein